MKELFDKHSFRAAENVTKKYSTSFYAGVKSLEKGIRADVHNIYGFVRYADEIVDSFHDYDQELLFEEFKRDTFLAIDRKISLNPILNAFQYTVNHYKIDLELIHQFLYSMEMDLNTKNHTKDSFDEYILGSAEVVGLMCLKIFVHGNEEEYLKLKPYAMKLGSAFQKINFLRDINADVNELGRIYFPNLDPENITPQQKLKIEQDIQAEFDEALIGIKLLPKGSRFGVYVSYKYYSKLLRKIKAKTIKELMTSRIRVPNPQKLMVFAKSYVRNTVNLL